jgi:glycine/D-amino acid oxidase-like deaminating enzyme
MDTAIVVGGGTFGASLARRLQADRVAVTLVDQFEPGDDRASSGGETRLIRCSHADDAAYARSARRARELWRAIAEEAGEPLYEECGVAWLASAADGWEAASERTLAALGIPTQRVDARELFPSVHTSDLAFTLFEPEAGVLRAQRAVRALARLALRDGATIERGRATPEDRGVRLDDGRRLDADVVVWACGGWLGRLFPALVRVRATRQDLYFLDGGPAWRGAPGWVDYDGAFYGTGDLDDLGIKVAPDAEGPDLDPDAPLPPTRSETEAAMRAYAARRFPALAGAPLRWSRSCRYELTADSHFIAAPHPEHDGVWLLGGGSGHGFKHGPAMAELVAAALRGGPAMPGRFGLHERVHERSLRTAGSNR